jgi:hypothetical protein
MPKKVKSFAMEEHPYEELFQMFKDSYAEVNISYCLNKYVKDLYRYLNPIQEKLKKSTEYNVPMSFIIETTAREPLFKYLDETTSEGMIKSSLTKELQNLQEKYDEHIKKNPSANQANDIEGLAKKYPIGSLIAYYAKMMVEDTKNLGNTPDDRFREAALEAGGKELVEFIKRIAPIMDKYNPDIIEVAKKKIKGSSKSKDKK